MRPPDVASGSGLSIAEGIAFHGSACAKSYVMYLLPDHGPPIGGSTLDARAYALRVLCAALPASIPWHSIRPAATWSPLTTPAQRGVTLWLREREAARAREARAPPAPSGPGAAKRSRRAE